MTGPTTNPRRETLFIHSDARGAELHFGSRDDEAGITITTAVRREMHCVWITKAAAADLGRSLLDWAGVLEEQM